METIALRQFDPLYIVFDCLFLVLLSIMLVWKKRYSALIVGGLAGILYMIVDYGIFHLLCGARSISPWLQLVLGLAVDVCQLRLHQFCLDLAVDF